MKGIVLLCLIFFNVLNISGQLSGGPVHPTSDNSSALDISANSNELLIPKLTSAVRTSMTNPSPGLLVFDLNFKSYFLYDGIKWLSLPGVDHANIKLDNLSSDNVVSNDKFGYATGIDSLYAIVGAPFHADSSGAAYIYKKRGNVWSEMAKITPDTNSVQLFGTSVSIDYPYAVVGAPACDSSRGIIYIFHCEGSLWKLSGKFKNPVDSVGKTQFGNSVDIDKLSVVAGAPFGENVAKAGGAAFVYKQEKNGWQFQTTLTDPGIKALDNFGYSVAIADSFIIVGSPLHDNDINTDEGIAYKFKLNSDGNGWSIQSILHPFHQADVFTYSTGTRSKTPVISKNWVYRKFGYCVDIKCNKTGNSSYEKVFTVIGAPESYFKFDDGASAENLGLIDLFTATPGSSLEKNALVISNKEIPDESDKNELLGASLSFSKFNADLLNETNPLDLQLLCGSPGYNNGKGKISRYSIDKVVDLIPVPAEVPGKNSYEFAWTKNYRATLLSEYTEKTSQAATGFSCSIFDTNSYIVSLLGLNLIGGGIIFKF